MDPRAKSRKLLKKQVFMTLDLEMDSYVDTIRMYDTNITSNKKKKKK